MNIGDFTKLGDPILLNAHFFGFTKKEGLSVLLLDEKACTGTLFEVMAYGRFAFLLTNSQLAVLVVLRVKSCNYLLFYNFRPFV